MCSPSPLLDFLALTPPPRIRPVIDPPLLPLIVDDEKFDEVVEYISYLKENPS